MPDGSALTVLLAATVTAALVTIALRRQSLARQAMRAAYFDEVIALFGDVRATVVPSGFPRISGRYGEHMFDVQVVPDTLTLRKLPALWLLVTLPCPQPVQASLDVMMRPTGVESFSNFAMLPRQIAPPQGFPADCALRSDGEIHVTLLEMVARHLGALDQDHLKEVVITPKGLRLVWLVQEADRGRYLIFRDSEMGQTALAAQQVLELLRALRHLHHDIRCSHQSEAA